MCAVEFGELAHEDSDCLMLFVLLDLLAYSYYP